jgi:transcriptional regulator with XRE-family HTH domain
MGSLRTVAKLEEFKLNEQTELLREMCQLLRVIAEPQFAKRDERLRASLLDAVGRSKAGAKAVHLMDGSRSQAAICEESGIDTGALSRLAKDLRAKELLAPDGRHPKLIISIPPTFFDSPKK